MNWVDVASNQCFSGNTLQNAVTNGYFVLKSSIPANGKMITKDEAYSYVYINPIPSKASNQLVVKSNLTAASLLPYSYTLYLANIDGNAYIGYTTSGAACASTSSVTVYSSSSSIAIGTALYYDAYGTEQLVATANAAGCGSQIYFRIGTSYITFQPRAALQCDGYIIDSIGTCSTTTTTTTTTSSTTTTTTTAAPSAGVDIANNTAGTNITNITINGVQVDGAVFPIVAGAGASATTTETGASKTIVVSYTNVGGDSVEVIDTASNLNCAQATSTSRTFAGQVVSSGGTVSIEMFDGSC